jgi:hypothetical protein
MTKQNETKFLCFSCFAKQAKFCETIFCFALFRVSRNKKAGCRNGNPIYDRFLTLCHDFLIYKRFLTLCQISYFIFNIIPLCKGRSFVGNCLEAKNLKSFQKYDLYVCIKSIKALQLL